MELVLQPTPDTCGQAYIAMITGKTIEEVILSMKTRSPASIGQRMAALDFYGVKHAERSTRISKKNPAPHEYSILTVPTAKLHLFGHPLTTNFRSSPAGRPFSLYRQGF